MKNPVSVTTKAFRIYHAFSGKEKSLDYQKWTFVNKHLKFIQLRKMNIAPLLNRPHVNGVTLREQNLYEISC